MRNEDSKISNSVDLNFAATLSKLIEENEKLKRRVDILEETFKDKLASLEQENDTLQRHLSAMISLTESELRKEHAESKKEPRRSGSRPGIEYPDDDRRPQYRTSQYCKRFKSSNEKIDSCKKYRENISSSYEGRSSLNRYKSRDSRHPSTCTKSVNNSTHNGRTSSNRYESRDDKHSSSYSRTTSKYSDGEASNHCHKLSDHTSRRVRDTERSNHESRRSGSSEKRKRAHSPIKEIKNDPPVISLPSSQEITLWSSTGEMHYKKIYSTPMKFFSFPDYKLISPLPNTPDQLKEKFKELGNKISPMPLLLSENQVLDKNESIKPSEEQTVEVNSVLTLSSEGNTKRETEVRTQTDNFEVQTVMKTDDVEHGVFKRKRRT